MNTPTKTKYWRGFESLHGIDEEFMWMIEDLLKENNISAEFTGTLKVTVEYISDEQLS